MSDQERVFGATFHKPKTFQGSDSSNHGHHRWILSRLQSGRSRLLLVTQHGAETNAQCAGARRHFQLFRMLEGSGLCVVVCVQAAEQPGVKVQKTKWITDFTIMHQYNKLIVGTGLVSISFFKLLHTI